MTFGTQPAARFHQVQSAGAQTGYSLLLPPALWPESGKYPIGRGPSYSDIAGAKSSNRQVRFTAITGLDYCFFHHGHYDYPETAYPTEERKLGYPAMDAMRRLEPDFMVATGDNVYYDHP